MDDLYSQYQQRYQQLRAMRDAGQMHPQQFLSEVQQLRWQDGAGVWRMIDPNGVVLAYNGQAWAPAPPIGQPYAAQPGAMQPGLQPPAYAQAPQPAPGAAAPAKPSLLRAGSPILVILPGILCGGLWFLYTFIGVFKSEGIRGVDWLTPLIVGGLPILFWVLKKPLDQLLMPLKPAIQKIPRALRMGVCFGIPLILGCGCSLVPMPGSSTASGYLALSFSALVSVVTAGVLLRF